ncbi:MAG: hypothetical protein WC290_01265 [archaeon]|jgi:hypothetical protein
MFITNNKIIITRVKELSGIFSSLTFLGVNKTVFEQIEQSSEFSLIDALIE